MFINPLERIKMDKLKFMMIRQRYGRISPFILKKTFELTASASILYYVGTGLVKVLSWINQYLNKVGYVGMMDIILNIAIIAASVAALGMIIMTIIMAFRY